MPKTLISRPIVLKQKAKPLQIHTDPKKDKLKEFKEKILSGSGFLKIYESIFRK